VLESEHADLLREGVALVLREVMEMEVARLAGADRYERSGERAAYRNGYRPRELQSRVGTLELAVPKLRSGPSYLPSFLEARKRSEQALLAVVMEAYVNGVSTRKVERLVEQLGVEGMSKSQVSRICRGLDERAEAFRSRPLEGAYPYVWLDARIERVREPAAGMVRQKALMVADGVHESGRREVVGIAVGEVESEAAWREFLRELVARGLSGVRLCVSDAHAGLRAAIGQVLGAQWQRCAVHFVRDMLGHVPRSGQPLVRGALKQIFAAQDREQAGQTLAGVVEQLGRVAPRWPDSSRPPRRSFWPTCASRASTGPRSEAPTPSSASTARSLAAPTSSASTRTTRRCYAWSQGSWWRSTTSASWPTATSAWVRWRNSKARRAGPPGPSAPTSQR
jgi:transposase-like protein